MSNRKKASLGRKIELVFISVFFLIVFAWVTAVLLYVYTPNKNSLPALASVAMDVVCMVVLIILGGSVAFDKDELGKTTKLFLGLVVATVWALLMDFMNWVLDGELAFGEASYMFTLLSLCMGAVLAFIFVLYLGSYMDDMYDMKNIHISSKVCACLNVIAFAITLTLALSKHAFDFVDGHYVVGELYDYVTAIPILTLVYMAGYAIKHVKTIGIYDVIGVVGYMVVMIIGALVEAQYSIGTSYVGISVADVFIFVMLQSKIIGRVKQQKEMLSKQVSSQSEKLESMADIITEEKKNVEKWIRKSNTDELTGYYNRFAYETEVANLEKEGELANLVYISADVNGLKVVNDTLGHEAGDELIIGACECMEKCFGPYGKLFRTGGDEFVAIIYADDEQLEKIKKSLDETTRNWFGKYNKHITLSCGYVKRAEAENKSIRQIAVLADKRMYEDKSKYYQRKGVDRRGQRDAHVALCATYTKILRINITDDTYQIVNMIADEQTKDRGFSEKISQWLHDFGTSGQVHADDLDEYLDKTRLEYISEHFKNDKAPLHIFYRRKFEDEYKKVMMEIIPTSDYTDEVQKLFLYVKSIE